MIPQPQCGRGMMARRSRRRARTWRGRGPGRTERSRSAALLGDAGAAERDAAGPARTPAGGPRRRHFTPSPRLPLRYVEAAKIANQGVLLGERG